MTFAVPAFEQQRDALLRDLRNLLASADVSRDSDFYVRASALASALQGISQHQAWIARQILPDVCDSDWLERHASLRGLSRKPAAAATGSAGIVVTATAPVVVAAGTELRSAAGVAYQVTTATSCAAGASTQVPIQAVEAGAAGNAPAGAALMLSTSVAGVQGSATAGALTGGADVESDDGLRERLLDVIRRPPAGGAAYDYRRWALEVAGVAAATVHPERRGAGTVDVSIMASGGLPSGSLLAAVQAHIDAVRPVTAGVQVLAPTPVPVAVTLTALGLDGISSAQAAGLIASNLAAYFATLGPGSTVIRSRIAAAISDVPGVIDFTLTAPAANVATTVSAGVVQLPTLGAVTLPS